MDGTINYFDRYKTAAAVFGAEVDPVCNLGDQSAIRKEAGDGPSYPSPYIGYWGFVHYERAGERLGFFQNSSNDEYHMTFQNPPGGPGGGGTYDPDKMMRKQEYRKVMLM